jgi:2-polyprenyl-6-methoxyphenol hydroxylase-like FAD-dependent oxidoreductase
MSGLLAARVLADCYEQVLVLDKDSFPPDVQNRKGVPQGRHAHALLTQGREVLEQLFPGLVAELISRGAVVYDQLGEMRRYVGGGYYWRGPSGLKSVMVSRALLESHVRTRLLARPNVRVVEGCDVLGLVANRDNSRITGVRRILREPGSAEETCSADLVVDATGRGSRMPTWLELLGYAAPEEERVEIGVCYATRHFRRMPGQLAGDAGAFVLASPTNRRVGIVIAQENMRWIVTLIGYQGDAPPTDPAGFSHFASTLSAPDIHELICSAEPLGDAVSARIPCNLRRHYQRLSRFPEGLVVLGDALCTFNPTYGQGMTVAGLEALALRAALQRGSNGVAARFFASATAELDKIWRITIGNDRRLVDSSAPRPAAARFLAWYIDRLHFAARRDPVAAAAFVRVTGLLDPPISLLRPRVAARVFWAQLRHARGRALTHS